MKEVWQVCWHLEFADKLGRAAGTQLSFLQGFEGRCGRCQSVKCCAASHCVGATPHSMFHGGVEVLTAAWIGLGHQDQTALTGLA